MLQHLQHPSQHGLEPQATCAGFLVIQTRAARHRTMITRCRHVAAGGAPKAEADQATNPNPRPLALCRCGLRSVPTQAGCTSTCPRTAAAPWGFPPPWTSACTARPLQAQHLQLLQKLLKLLLLGTSWLRGSCAPLSTGVRLQHRLQTPV